MELTDGISSRLLTQCLCYPPLFTVDLQKEPLVLIPTARQILPLLTEGVMSTHQQKPLNAINYM